MPDDAELLRQYAQDGSQEAFTELVRRRIDLVYSIALRRVGEDRQSAEDVVQIVFQDLAKKASTLIRHPTLTGWLFTSTRYAAENVKRSAQRRRDREQTVSDTRIIESGSLDTDIRWSQLGPILEKLLDGLGERDRLAILLRFYDDRPYAQIGHAIATSEDGARMRVQRALEKLRLKLETQGIRSTPIALAAIVAENAVASAPVGLAAHVAATSLAVLATTLPVSLIPIMTTLKMTSTIAGIAILVAIGGAEWHEQSKINAAYRELGLEKAKLATREHDEALVSHARPNVPAAIRTGAIRADAAAVSATVAHGTREEEIRRRFSRFFKERGLTAEQISRFINLMNQIDDARTDLQEAIRKEGLSDQPAVRAMQQDLTRPINDELRQLLGDDGYSAYIAYSRLSYYGFLVQPLAGLFSAANMPVDDGQTLLLTQIVAANDHPVKIAASDLSGESTIDWSSVAAQSSKILTPAQLALLQTQIQQLNAQQDANIARLKALRGAPGNP